MVMVMNRTIVVTNSAQMAVVRALAVILVVKRAWEIKLELVYQPKQGLLVQELCE
jgi:hypothetical protein